MAFERFLQRVKENQAKSDIVLKLGVSKAKLEQFLSAIPSNSAIKSVTFASEQEYFSLKWPASITQLHEYNYAPKSHGRPRGNLETAEIVHLDQESEEDPYRYSYSHEETLSAFKLSALAFTRFLDYTFAREEVSKSNTSDANYIRMKLGKLKANTRLKILIIHSAIYNSHKEAITTLLQQNTNIIYCFFGSWTNANGVLTPQNLAQNNFELFLQQYLQQFWQSATSIKLTKCVETNCDDSQVALASKGTNIPSVPLKLTDIAKYLQPSETNIHSLDISDPNLDLQVWLQMLAFTPNLNRLSFSNRKTTSAELQEILNTISQNNTTKISSLDLSYCQLQDQDLLLIIEFIKRYPHLAIINLSNNNFTNDSIVQFAEFLKTNTTLVRLYLYGNNFKELGLTALGNALTQNRHLCSLGLNCYQRIGYDTCYGFLKKIKANNAIVELTIFEYVYPDDKRRADDPISITTRTINALLQKNKAKSNDALLASRSNKPADLQAAIASGVSPYTFDSDGNNLLHAACSGNALISIAFLRTLQINLHVTNNAGYSVLQLHQSNASVMQALQGDIPNPMVIGLASSSSSANAIPAIPTSGKKASATTSKRNAAAANSASITSFFTPAQKKLATSNTSSSSSISSSSSSSSLVSSTTTAPMSSSSSSLSYSSTSATLLSSSAAAISSSSSSANMQVDLPAIPAASFATIVVQSQLGNHEFLRQQLYSPTFTATDAYGQNLCHVLASTQDANGLNILLESKKFNVNTQDHYQRTPLHVSLMQALVSPLVVSLLLTNGADPNLMDSIGAPPILLACGGFIPIPYDLKGDKDRAKCVTDLLHHGAKPNIIFYDHETQTPNFTLLHKACYRGLYSVAKRLLEHLDVNAMDGKGNTPLHYACLTQNIDIVGLLLQDLRITIHLRNAAGHTALETLQQLPDPNAKIIGLIQNHMRRSTPGIAAGVRWQNPLTLHYKSRESSTRNVSFDFSETHSSLSSKTSSAANATGNVVAANLMFVISDATYIEGDPHPKKLAKVDLTFVENHHVTNSWQTQQRVTTNNPISGFKVRNRSRDALERVKARFTLAPADVQAKATNDVRIETLALTPAALDQLFSQVEVPGSKSFELRVNHSEVALLDHLEQDDTISNIVTAFKDTRDVALGCKVYAIILNINSKFYLCPDCEIGILGTQNSNSTFIQKLTHALGIAGFILPKHKPISMLSLFSSKVPYPYGSSKKTKDNHVDYSVDINANHNNGLILCQDNESCGTTNTLYLSSKKH